jgi:purine/pyrimidine-nucleoside phosphorylase
MANIPAEFKGVTVVTKANVYFDAKVISHSVLFGDGSKKTLGVIHPGQYHFNTDKAERMEIVAGQCAVRIDGQGATSNYGLGQCFDVPSKAGFTIEVSAGLCEYICSFLNS